MLLGLLVSILESVSFSGQSAQDGLLAPADTLCPRIYYRVEIDSYAHLSSLYLEKKTGPGSLSDTQVPEGHLPAMSLGLVFFLFLGHC